MAPRPARLNLGPSHTPLVAASPGQPSTVLPTSLEPSFPLWAPCVARLQPYSLTTTIALAKHFSWERATRILSGSLPLVPEGLLSTL